MPESDDVVGSHRRQLEVTLRRDLTHR